jgi:hypothetical protein
MAVYIEYKGKKLYLRGRNKFYYLTYQKEGALDEIPEGYKIVYNKRGLPYVKRIGK